MKNRLTDKDAARVQATENDVILNDGGGLNLRIRSNGLKTWIYRYTVGGVAHKETLGEFPAVSLA